MEEFLSSQTVIQIWRVDQSIVVYLSISEEVVSATLVQEVEKKEHPVNFVSQTLHAAETRYHMIEKVGLALVLTARRMCPYF